METARKAAGLSRQQLAAAAGIDPRTIYTAERRGVLPHRSTRFLLALALQQPLEDLFPPEVRNG